MKAREQMNFAQMMEEGKRVALFCFLENHSPHRQIHVEELAKQAQRMAQVRLVPVNT